MARKNGRPPSINSRFFHREFSDGFKNVIDSYQVLWNAGYRPEMDLNDFIGVGTGEQK